MKKTIAKVLIAVSASAALICGCSSGKSEQTEAEPAEFVENDETDVSKTDENSTGNFEPTDEILNASPLDKKIQFGDTCVEFPTTLSAVLACGAENVDKDYNTDYLTISGNNIDVDMSFGTCSFVLTVLNDTSGDLPLKDCTVTGYKCFGETPTAVYTLEGDTEKEESVNYIYYAGGLGTDMSFEDAKNVWGEPDDGDNNAMVMTFTDEPTYSHIGRSFKAVFDRSNQKVHSIEIEFGDDLSKPEREIFTKSTYNYSRVSYTLTNEFDRFDSGNRLLKEFEYNGNKYYAYIRFDPIFSYCNTGDREDFLNTIFFYSPLSDVYAQWISSENDDYIIVGENSMRDGTMRRVWFFNKKEKYYLDTMISVHNSDGSDVTDFTKEMFTAACNEAAEMWKSAKKY